MAGFTHWVCISMRYNHGFKGNIRGLLVPMYIPGVGKPDELTVDSSGFIDWVVVRRATIFICGFVRWF
jgi:hypothetical protein